MKSEKHSIETHKMHAYVSIMFKDGDLPTLMTKHTCDYL